MNPTLEIKNVLIKSANLNGESSLPSILPVLNVQTQKSLKLDEDDEIFFDVGKIRSIYPYKQQDLYDRALNEKEYKAVILENKYLKAMFLPELGGRLWSLFDKVEGRELLYVNDCIRFCNLALCNAWFSGGVEWNIGMIGHNPLTCSPLFAATLKAADGTPILRMYEYERLRNVTYQMDFSLPESSKMLICRMRICNLNDSTIPMYWWSNIAVPETKHSRIIVPAESSYYSYWTTIDKTPMPYRGGKDVTYPVNTECSMDYFYKTFETKRKYIAAVGKDGYGLVQTSTRRLKGRKLFVWGQGQGGHTWQRFLTDKAGDYSEIQAGLGQTQYECIPMPPLSTWEWVEAYGAISAQPAAAHGDWCDARAEIENKLDEKLSEDWLEEYLISSKKDYVFKKGKVFQNGSGFGALENKRRSLAGERAISQHLDFGEVQSRQKHWLLLLEQGHLPSPSVDEPPASYMVGNHWYDLLNSAHGSEDKNWYAWYHKGVMQISNTRYEQAINSFKKSIEMQPSCWAYYGLAVCRYTLGDNVKSIEYIKLAYKLNPSDISLARDMFRLMNENECYQEIIELYNSMDAALQNDGKLKFYVANSYAHTDQIEKAEKILYENGCLIIPDIREGEMSITNLWLYIEEQKYKKQNKVFDINSIKVPPNLDYRMGCACE